MHKLIPAALAIAVTATMAGLSSSSAFAEYQPPLTVASQVGGHPFNFGGTQPPVAEIAVLDGISATAQGPWVTNDTQTVNFTIGDNWRNDLRLFIHATAVPGDPVDPLFVAGQNWTVSATYTDDMGGTATATGGPYYLIEASGLVIPASAFGGGTLFSSVGAQLTSLSVTFTYLGINVGGNFSLDLISNPEPGTLALFGLGMLGLSGVALRRRKAKKAKSAEAKA